LGSSLGPNQIWRSSARSEHLWRRNVGDFYFIAVLVVDAARIRDDPRS
jgi:hypothetical protein